MLEIEGQQNAIPVNIMGHTYYICSLSIIVFGETAIFALLNVNESQITLSITHNDASSIFLVDMTFLNEIL